MSSAVKGWCMWQTVHIYAPSGFLCGIEGAVVKTSINEYETLSVVMVAEMWHFVCKVKKIGSNFVLK